MNIRSTHPAATTAANSVTPRSSEQSTQTKPENNPTKPISENWHVGDDIYAGTDELLKSFDSDELQNATYSYSVYDKQAPLTKSEKVKNSIGTAIAGAGGGAVVGGIALAAGSILGAVGDVVSTLAGGSGGSGMGSVAAWLAVPAAVGAVMGAVSGYNAQPEPEVHRIRGELREEDGKLHFFPGGQVSKKVDLTEHAKAEVPGLTPRTKEESGDGALKGALTGVGMAATSVFPPVGMTMGLFNGSSYGEALGKGDRTAFSGAVGALAGVGASAGALYGIMNYGWTGFGVAAGVLGVAGAVLGAQKAKAQEKPEMAREYGGQWWNQTQAGRVKEQY